MFTEEEKNSILNDDVRFLMTLAVINDRTKDETLFYLEDKYGVEPSLSGLQSFILDRCKDYNEWRIKNEIDWDSLELEVQFLKEWEEHHPEMLKVYEVYYVHNDEEKPLYRGTSSDIASKIFKYFYEVCGNENVFSTEYMRKGYESYNILDEIKIIFNLKEE